MWGCGARLVWLMLLLAFLGPALGGEEEDGEVVAEEKDNMLSDELREEDGVLLLHEHNFARALSEHRLLLVEFCKCCPDAGRDMGRDVCGDGCGQVIWVGDTGQRHGCGCGQKQTHGQGHRQGHRCRTGHGVRVGQGHGYE